MSLLLHQIHAEFDLHYMFEDTLRLSLSSKTKDTYLSSRKCSDMDGQTRVTR